MFLLILPATELYWNQFCKNKRICFLDKYINFRENYLRFSSQIFSLENFHESLHLTNHAVQCKYTNVHQRDKALPDENMWDCHTFQAYLKQIGHLDKWNDVIMPGIREGIIGAMLASQDTMDRRPNTFEVYGADFMIAEDFTPWLIEINSSPDLSASTSVTARMCPQMIEDLVKGNCLSASLIFMLKAVLH